MVHILHTYYTCISAAHTETSSRQRPLHQRQARPPTAPASYSRREKQRALCKQVVAGRYNTGMNTGVVQVCSRRLLLLRFNYGLLVWSGEWSARGIGF